MTAGGRFNYWVDRRLRRCTYEHTRLKIHMVGLDVTRKIVLRPNLWLMSEEVESDKSRFILDITKFYTDFHWHQEKFGLCHQ